MTTPNAITNALSLKDAIRSQVLGSTNKGRKSIKLTFFGAEIELVQPNVGQIIKQTIADSFNAVDVLIEYAHVPGTSDKLFEESDREVLMQLPYTDEFKSLTEAIESLTNLLISDAEKN